MGQARGGAKLETALEAPDLAGRGREMVRPRLALTFSELAGGLRSAPKGSGVLRGEGGGFPSRLLPGAEAGRVCGQGRRSVR